MKRKKIFWHLYPSYFLITVISLILISLFANHTFESFYYAETEAKLLEKARILGEVFRPLLINNKRDDIQKLCASFGKKAGTQISVLSPKGEMIGHSLNLPRSTESFKTRAEIHEALLGEYGKSLRYSPMTNQNQLNLAIKVLNELDQTVLGILRVSVPVTAIQTPLKNLYLQVLLSLIILAVLIGIMMYWLSKKISRPLEIMRKHAETLARGDLSKKLPLRDLDSYEIEQLADSMNEMGEQLSAKIETITNQKGQQYAILKSMQEGVLSVNNNNEVVLVNHATKYLFDLDSDADYKGSHLLEVIRLAQINELMGQVLEQKVKVKQEVALDNGKILIVKGTPLYTIDDEFIGGLLVFNDITHLKELEGHRREFVGNVSHELRTPLTAITGYIDTLLDDEIYEKETTTKFLKIIQRQTKHLRTIIEDLLALSEMDRSQGGSGVEFKLQNLSTVVDSAIQCCVHRADEKRIGLQYIEHEPLQIKVNSRLIEQALINLIDNAIKYSDSETLIRISVESDPRNIKINITDQGNGIAPEHHQRLFERFYRVDKARSKELGGTGLGLAIVKHIVMVHEGKLEVSSQVGEGSTFSISLPRVN